MLRLLTAKFICAVTLNREATLTRCQPKQHSSTKHSSPPKDITLETTLETTDCNQRGAEYREKTGEPLNNLGASAHSEYK